MSTVKLNDSFEDPITQEVFNDIKKTRSTDYIGNLWKYLSFNPFITQRYLAGSQNHYVKRNTH